METSSVHNTIVLDGSELDVSFGFSRYDERIHRKRATMLLSGGNKISILIAPFIKRHGLL